MPISTPEAKRHAHELIEQLGPSQVAAVLQLLEVMVEPAEEPLSQQELAAVEASREYFRQHPAEGVPFDQFAAQCGFTMDQILGHED